MATTGRPSPSAMSQRPLDRKQAHRSAASGLQRIRRERRAASLPAPLSPRLPPMPPPRPPLPLVERFRAELEALGGAPGDRGLLGVAVSGGPDSLALLLLAEAAWPGQVRAATVDHGLRAEGVAEAAHVGAICAAIGCLHDILTVRVAPGGEGMQGE